MEVCGIQNPLCSEKSCKKIWKKMYEKNKSKNKKGTGTRTMFVTYLSLSPTLFKHEIHIYWPIMKNKVTNDEHRNVFNVHFYHFLIEMSFNTGDRLRRQSSFRYQ